jgi:hypothetical protein
VKNKKKKLAATWQKSMKAKIAGVLKLPPDWSEVGAEAPNKVAVKKSFALVKLFERYGSVFYSATVAAMDDDAEGIIFMWTKPHGREAFIRCYNNGQVDALLVDAEESRTRVTSALDALEEDDADGFEYMDIHEELDRMNSFLKGGEW